MVIFGFIAAVTLAGIGYVLISLKKDSPPINDFQPISPQIKFETIKKPGIFSKIFQGKKKLTDFSSAEPDFSPQKKSLFTSLTNLKGKIKIPSTSSRTIKSDQDYSAPQEVIVSNPPLEVNKSPEQPKQTLSNPLPSISTKEADEIRQNVRQTSEIQEWQEKYSKLDRMFDEKSKLLEETTEKLNSEIQNRKDYTKVKEIVDSELIETKNKLKTTQSEIKALTEELNILKYTQNKPANNPLGIHPVSNLESEIPAPMQNEKIEIEKPASETERQDKPEFLSLRPDILDINLDDNNPNTKE